MTWEEDEDDEGEVKVNQEPKKYLSREEETTKNIEEIKQIQKQFKAIKNTGDEKSLNDIPEHESILIYGQPKTGKTFAACSFIERIVKDGGHVYIINTDNGIKRTLKAYFKDRVAEIAKHISYYLVLDFEKIYNIVKEIKNKVKEIKRKLGNL